MSSSSQDVVKTGFHPISRDLSMSFDQTAGFIGQIVLNNKYYTAQNDMSFLLIDYPGFHLDPVTDRF